VRGCLLASVLLGASGRFQSSLARETWGPLGYMCTWIIFIGLISSTRFLREEGAHPQIVRKTQYKVLQKYAESENE
jgi:hypothetical protein